MQDSTFLDRLLSLPIIEQVRISPDARFVAFEWAHIHENMDVFVVPGDGSSQPVAFTQSPQLTELVSWSPDPRAILVSEDHDGDEHARLYSIDLRLDPSGRLEPGPPQPLTEDRPPYFLRGGSLSLDRAHLYYGANYDFESSALTGPTLIYRHDLRTGSRTPLSRPSHPNFVRLELNKSGTHLVYTRKDGHPSGRQVYLVDVDGKEDREILNFGDQAKAFARWLPDGEHLLVIAEIPGHPGSELQEYTRLGVYHWPSSGLRWLIDNPSRSLEGAWASPDGTILIDEISGANHRPSYIEPPTRGWMQSESSQIREVSFPSLTENMIPIGRHAGGAWIVLTYSSTAPKTLKRLEISPHGLHDSVETFTLKPLTDAWRHSSLIPSDLTPAENFEWASSDGLPIQGWLYRCSPNPMRAVIYLHGGPSSHSEDRLNPEIQYLVRRGFNVLDINYRGSTGFGLKFREAIKKVGWGGQEQEDITRGALALIELGLAVPERVGVTGTSFGGYCAWCQITRLPVQVIAAAAPICGMTDLVVDYETTRPDGRPLSEEMMGGSPQQVPERYFTRSPIHFVSQIQGRLLIVQGALDPNVTPANLHAVMQVLDAHKVSYETLIFEDEGHGIYKPKNLKILYTRLADFFSSALN